MITCMETVSLQLSKELGWFGIKKKKQHKKNPVKLSQIQSFVKLMGDSVANKYSPLSLYHSLFTLVNNTASQSVSGKLWTEESSLCATLNLSLYVNLLNNVN